MNFSVKVLLLAFCTFFAIFAAAGTLPDDDKDSNNYIRKIDKATSYIRKIISFDEKATSEAIESYLSKLQLEGW